MFTFGTLLFYILKSFIRPFVATFLIVLFVLVMQILWLAFDDIAGKGIAEPSSLLSAIAMAEKMSKFKCN